MNFLASLTQGISSQVNKVINAISFSNAWMYVNQTKTRIIANIVQYSIRRDPNIHFEINLQDYPLFLLNHPNPKLNDFKNKGI